MHGSWPTATTAAAIAWVGFVAADAFLVFRNKPISESEIKREIERQAGPH